MDRMPAAALQSSRSHAALIWIIRGTGAFIAGAAVITGCFVLVSLAFFACRVHLLAFIAVLALLLLALGLYGIRRTRIVMAVIFATSACYFFGCLLVTTIRGQPQFSNFGWFGVPLFALGSLAALWLLGVVFGLFIKKGYDMWRRVDKITVADFASVFALFAARVFHYFLPAHLPKAVNDHLWVGFRDPFSDKGSRMLWTWLALYLCYKLIKASLLKILDLNPPVSPQSPIPSVPSVPPDPSDPFVPFNPYDLSKNSPTTFRPSPPLDES